MATFSTIPRAQFGALSIASSGVAGSPTFTSTIGTVNFNDGGRLSFEGTGMAVSAGGDIFTGNVTRLLYSKPAGDSVFLIALMNTPLSIVAGLFNGGDELTVLAAIFAGDDNVNGSSDPDVLFGFDGNDTIDANAGNDLLRGGPGADLLIGGPGFDVADYRTSAVGVTVNAGSVNPQVSPGDASGDSLSSTIEGIFGSQHVDSLTGGGTTIVLAGFGGDDALTGAGSNNHFYGGEGADTLAGGGGFDFARYDQSSAGVIAALSGTGTGGEAQGDVIGADIEGLVGSLHEDTLTGNGGSNQLWGLAGDDNLSGGQGVDFLVGGAGADDFITAAAAVAESVFDFIFDFVDGADSITLSGWTPESVLSFESNGHVFITSSAVGFTGGVAVLNATLAQVEDQIVFA